MAKPWSPEEKRILRMAIGPDGVNYDELEKLLPGRTRSALQTEVHNARIEAEFGVPLRVKDSYQLPIETEWRIHKDACDDCGVWELGNIGTGGPPTCSRGLVLYNAVMEERARRSPA